MFCVCFFRVFLALFLLLLECNVIFVELIRVCFIHIYIYILFELYKSVSDGCLDISMCGNLVVLRMVCGVH